MKEVFLKMHGINDVNEFVQRARLVDGDVSVTRGKWCIDGKSIMGMFSIDVSQGCTVEYPEDAKEFEVFLQKFLSD